MNRDIGEHSDLPANGGFLSRLHAGLGRLAVGVATRVRPPITLGVRLIATNEQNEILLIRQTYMPGLALPGGGVEAGETCREALLREVFEEAGVVVQNNLDLFNVYHNRALKNRDHVVLFVTQNVEQVTTPANRYEIASAKFYPLEALPGDVTHATRKRISEVFHGSQASDHW